MSCVRSCNDCRTGAVLMSRQPYSFHGKPKHIFPSGSPLVLNMSSHNICMCIYIYACVNVCKIVTYTDRQCLQVQKARLSLTRLLVAAVRDKELRSQLLQVTSSLS